MVSKEKISNKIASKPSIPKCQQGNHDSKTAIAEQIVKQRLLQNGATNVNSKTTTSKQHQTWKNNRRSTLKLRLLNLKNRSKPIKGWWAMMWRRQVASARIRTCEDSQQTTTGRKEWVRWKLAQNLDWDEWGWKGDGRATTTRRHMREGGRRTVTAKQTKKWGGCKDQADAWIDYNRGCMAMWRWRWIDLMEAAVDWIDEDSCGPNQREKENTAVDWIDGSGRGGRPFLHRHYLRHFFVVFYLMDAQRS